MSSRKRKHGYEDDDHVVKKPLVTEEVSGVSFASVQFLHYTESNKDLLLCRSGLMKTWICCNSDYYILFYSLNVQIHLTSRVKVQPVLCFGHKFLLFAIL